MRLTLAQVAHDVFGTIERGEPDALVTGVSTDTRTVKHGDLFVALRGPNFDGHAFVAAAAEKGAHAALVASDAPEIHGDLPIVMARRDTLEALGDLARAWRLRHEAVRVVGVTGSAGKTTTKEMIAAILGEVGNTLATVGNLNNLIGVPQTLFRLGPEHAFAVIEMGMSTFGEIAREAEMARPEVGLITLVAPAHTEGLGGIEGVARAKGELFAALPPMGTAIVNVDDPHITPLLAASPARVIRFGRDPGADVRPLGEPELTLDGTRAHIAVQGEPVDVVLPQVGAHQVMNAAAAMATALALEIPRSAMVRGLSHAQSAVGRMTVRKSKGRGVTILDDTYNANPRSMAMALETVSQLALKGHVRAVAILGDMRELGETSASQHREIGRLAASSVAALYAFGPEAAETAAAAREAGLSTVAHDITFESLAAVITRDLRPGDLVLVKGSRGMRTERFVAALGVDEGAH